MKGSEEEERDEREDEAKEHNKIAFGLGARRRERHFPVVFTWK
jgi:hypothetical protein